MHGPMNVKQK